MGERAIQIDPRAMCPTTDKVCMARLALIKTYERDGRANLEGPMVEFPDVEDDNWNGEEMYPRSPFYGMSPDNNGVKLTAKLLEYDGWAKATGCDGPLPEDCPTRIIMDNSEVRADLLSFLRSIKKIFS